MPSEIRTAAELWLRPSPFMDPGTLRRLVVAQTLTRTPRLGVRDPSHPKGYTVGQPALLRLFGWGENELLARQITVTGLTVRRIIEVTPGDLAGCEPAYRTPEDVRRGLSFFEGRIVSPREPVTIVTFAYDPTG